MKNREQAVRWITDRLDYETTTDRLSYGDHLGWQDMRDFMDFLYKGPPQSISQELVNKDEGKHKETEVRT